jgi:phage terminase large subunit GpA-like protein
MTPEKVVAKVVSTYQRGIVPDGAVKLTAFIDVQGTALYYVVCAWQNDFTGTVIDYGTYPEQDRLYFTLREVTKTLATAKTGTSLEGQIYDGLDKLTTRLLGKEWLTDTDKTKKIDRIMIDANWGTSTSTVKLFCKQSRYSALLIPSHGVGITADRKPLNEYELRKGERVGWNWRVEAEGHLRFDTNSWKTFVAQRLSSAMGDKGCLTLFNASAIHHRMFAEHCASEYPIPTEGLGRVVNVWKAKPNRDNHLWDCLIGAAVAASEQGILAIGHSPQSGAIKKKRRAIEVSW